MFQKLKTKKIFSKRSLAFLSVAVLFATLASSFLVPVSSVQAQTDNCLQPRVSGSARVCTGSEIMLTTSILPSNSLTASNDTSSGQVTFTVQIVLNQPADLIIGTDKIITPGSLTPNVTFQGIGVTLTGQDTSQFCGTATYGGFSSPVPYPKCQSQNNIGEKFDTTNYDDFSGGSSGTLTAGAVVYKHTFTIPQSDYAHFFNPVNINNGTDNTTGINLLYATPDIQFNGLLATGGSDWETPSNAGKAVYVQIFPNAAALAAAASNPGSLAPSCNSTISGTGYSGGTLTAGAACNPANDQCGAHLGCDPNASPTPNVCVPALQVGATCNSGDDLCDQENNLTCTNGTCQSAAVTGSSILSCVPANGSLTASGANLVPNQSAGGPVVGLLNFVIGGLLGLIQELIYGIFFWLIAPMIQAMLSIHAYTDTFVAVIYPGWIVVRNICNIFFIVALIIIAMATLFRVESYQYRNLIVQLILAALLINFSLVIAQAVLALADTVQAQFLPANVTVIRSLAGNLMVAYRGQIINSSNFMNGTFSALVQQIFWLALSLGSFCVFCAIAVFLVIRIVALWVLLLISPVAYACGVLPATSHYRSEWWSQFLKYAFFTPIMAFFLNMTALMVNASQNNPVLKQINSGALASQLDSSTNSGIAAFVFSVASNMLLLVFLLAGLMVAEKFGVMGASAVTGAAKKGIYAPFAGAGWLGKRGLGYVGKKWNDKTVEWFMESHEGHPPPGKFKKAMFAISNPRAFTKGWQTRSEELAHAASASADAAGRMVAEQLLTGGALEIPYLSFAERHDEAEKAKDMENMKKESLMDLAVKAEGLKGAEGRRTRRAIVKAALKNGFQDDLLSMKHFAEKYADDDGTFNSAAAVNRFLFGYLGHDDQAMRFMAEDLEELGKTTGHWEYLGHAYFDNDNRTWKRGMEERGHIHTRRGNDVEDLKNTWQVKYAVSEAKKASAQVRAGMAPHNTMVLRAELDASGKFKSTGNTVGKALFGYQDGHIDDFQKAMLGQFNTSTLTQFARYGQSRQEEWHLAPINNYDKNSGEVILEHAEDASRIQSLWKENPGFVKALYSRISGIPLDAVAGMKFTTLDSTGKRDVLTLGNYNLQEPPIVKSVKTEVLKNSAINIDKNDKETYNRDLNSIIPNIYNGTFSRTNVLNSLSSSSAPTVRANANLIADDLYKQISVQVDQGYNPTTILDRIDSKYNNQFAPKELSELAREINSASSAAFNKAVTTGGKFSKTDIEAEVRRRIGTLRASGGNYARLTTADEDLIINHIKPI